MSFKANPNRLNLWTLLNRHRALAFSKAFYLQIIYAWFNLIHSGNFRYYSRLYQQPHSSKRYARTASFSTLLFRCDPELDETDYIAHLSNELLYLLESSDYTRTFRLFLVFTLAYKYLTRYKVVYCRLF